MSSPTTNLGPTVSQLSTRPLRRRHRRALRLGLGALAVATIGSVFGSGSAFAEATVVSSTPADGSTIATSPTEISIVFTEELGEANTVGLECNTELVTLGRLEVGDDGLSVTVPVPTALPKGTCVAKWLVSDTEGEPNGSGNITFNVSSDPAIVETTTTVDPAAGAAVTTIAGATTTPVDESVAAAPTDIVSPADAETGQGPLWLGRLISVLGVAILFGALITIAAAWPEGVEYLVAVKFIRTIWIVAVIGTVLYVAAATAAATGGSLGSGLNPTNWMDLFDAGAPGIAAIARLILVLGSGWVAFRPDRVIDPTTQMAGLGIPALAVATIGFSRTGGDLAVIGIATGVLHALAMAIWIGGVVLLARVVLAGPGEEDLVHAVRGFCRISNIAIVVTVVTGLIQTVRLDGGDLFGSSHGRVLLLKTVAVAVMLFIAIKARQFVNDRLARADEMTVPMADRLRRAFGTEAAIGILAVALERVDVRVDATERRRRQLDHLRHRPPVPGRRGRPRRHGAADVRRAGAGRHGGRRRRSRVRPVRARHRVHGAGGQRGDRHHHPAGPVDGRRRRRPTRRRGAAVDGAGRVAGPGQCGHRGRCGQHRPADVRDPQCRRVDADHEHHDPARHDRTDHGGHHHDRRRLSTPGPDPPTLVNHRRGETFGA